MFVPSTKPDFDYSNSLTDHFEDTLKRLWVGKKNAKWLHSIFEQYKTIQDKYVSSMQKLCSSIPNCPYPEEAFLPSSDITKAFSSLSDAAMKMQQQLGQEIVVAMETERRSISDQCEEIREQYEKLKKRVKDCRATVKKIEARTAEAYSAWREAEKILRNSPSDPKGQLANKVHALHKNTQKCEDQHLAAVNTTQEAEKELDKFVNSGLTKMEKLDWSRLFLIKSTILRFSGCVSTLSSAMSMTMGDLMFSANDLSPTNNMKEYVENNKNKKISNVTTVYICQNEEHPTSGVSETGYTVIEEAIPTNAIKEENINNTTIVSNLQERLAAATAVSEVSQYTQNPLQNKMTEQNPVPAEQIVLSPNTLIAKTTAPFNEKSNEINNPENSGIQEIAQVPKISMVRQIDDCCNYLVGYPMSHPPEPLPDEEKIWQRCRATYSYEAEVNESDEANDDVRVMVNEEVIVYSIPPGEGETWWQCLKKNGEKGQVPSNYFKVEEVIPQDKVALFEELYDSIRDPNRPDYLKPGVNLYTENSGYYFITTEEYREKCNLALNIEQNIETSDDCKKNDNKNNNQIEQTPIITTQNNQIITPNSIKSEPLINENISIPEKKTEINTFTTSVLAIEGLNANINISEPGENVIENSATSITMTYDNQIFNNTEPNNIEDDITSLIVGRNAEAMFDYDRTSENEITIRVGDILSVLDISGEWALVRNIDGMDGYCPCSYIRPYNY